LADTYDALTSIRSYKGAFDHDAAKSIIIESADRFDPLILAGFLDLENEFIAIRDAFLDGFESCAAGATQTDRRGLTHYEGRSG
jgi:HD-GYP domain-containing protein (c-di-GMP phosphodiesterase class II)